MNNDSKKTSILMVVVKKENLWKIVDSVKQQIDTKFIILKSSNQNYEDVFFVIFQAIPTQLKNIKFKFTIVHKRGKCYYTINALNQLIFNQIGYVDDSYVIDWKQYQNKIIFYNSDKFNQDALNMIDTKLYKLIKKNK